MWTATIEPDADKATDGAEVGSITATYTDEGLFVRPFVVSLRAEFAPKFWAKIVEHCRTELAAETNRRQMQAKLESALASELNK